jgi:hypothetical protein
MKPPRDSLGQSFFFETGAERPLRKEVLKVPRKASANPLPISAMTCFPLKPRGRRNLKKSIDYFK